MVVSEKIKPLLAYPEIDKLGLVRVHFEIESLEHGFQHFNRFERMGFLFA